MKKTLLILMLVAFTATSCTGSFNLTKKVYNAHRSQSDKWADELLFLVCVLVPVYGIATWADAIIFNSIEFWTGENPVSMSKTIKSGKDEIKMSKAGNDELLVSNKAGSFTLQKTEEGMVAKDAKGKTLFVSKTTADGGVAIYNEEMKLVQNYSASEVEAKKLAVK